MTIELRSELFVLAIIFLIIIVKKINKRKLQLKYSLNWFLAAVLIVGIAAFPQIIYKATAIFGIKTPSNFIFLVVLMWLIVMNLSLTVIVSEQSMKIKEIIQRVSLDNYEKEREEKAAVSENEK